MTDEILAALLAFGSWAGISELAAYTGRSPPSVRAGLARLIRDGKAERRRRNGRRWPPSYRLR